MQFYQRLNLPVCRNCLTEALSQSKNQEIKTLFNRCLRRSFRLKLGCLTTNIPIMIFMNSFKRISCPNFPSINVHWCLNGGAVLVSVWTKLIQLYDSPPRRLTRRFPRHNPHFLRSSASGWNLRDKNWNICKYLIHIMSGRLVSCHNSQDACLIDYGLWLWAWQASSCGHLPCSCAQPLYNPHVQGVKLSIWWHFSNSDFRGGCVARIVIASPQSRNKIPPSVWQISCEGGIRKMSQWYGRGGYCCSI